MFTIWVVDAGKTHYVGERETREAAQASADIYNQDPIASGWFYVVRRNTERAETCPCGATVNGEAADIDQCGCTIDPAVRSDVTIYGAGSA